jgi:hypothetical protein
MANINLATNTAEYSKQNYVSSVGGLLSVFAALIFTGALYGGMIFWKNNLNNKVDAATSAYNAGYEELKNGKNIEVIDLQNRIFLSKELIKKDKEILDALVSVEKSIVSDVYLTSYRSAKNEHTLNIDGVANSYSDLSRQIMSFKLADNFSNVNIDSASILESGKISFSIKIEFK